MDDVLLTNLLFKGRACREQGLLRESREYFEQCLEASWREGEFTVMARAVNEIGNLSVQEGRFDQAKSCYDKALELARRTSNRGIVGTVLGSLGNLNFLLGGFERRWRKDIDTRIASEEQDREWKQSARLYHELGTTFRREEKLEEAIGFYSRSIRMARRADERELLFESCVAISEVLIRMERPHQARNFIRRALAASSRLGDPQKIARALVVFGSIERERGKYERAEKALRKALCLIEATPPPPSPASGRPAAASSRVRRRTE
jgi:tetratricopeptide (TPR) repeat protein